MKFAQINCKKKKKKFNKTPHFFIFWGAAPQILPSSTIIIHGTAHRQPQHKSVDRGSNPTLGNTPTELDRVSPHRTAGRLRSNPKRDATGSGERRPSLSRSRSVCLSVCAGNRSHFVIVFVSNRPAALAPNTWPHTAHGRARAS